MIFKRKNNNNGEMGEDMEQKPETCADVTEICENTETVENPTVEGLEEALEEARNEATESTSDPAAVLEKALQEEKDRTLRLCAELDNVRRRFAREMMDERKYSGIEVIRAFLPVMDNLQRAIVAAEQQNADAALLEGVQMVYQQMTDALRQNHCTKIEAQDQPFDPNFHQAISQMPNADLPDNTVMIVALDGYMLHDRVVRASQVVVSKKP